MTIFRFEPKTKNFARVGRVRIDFKIKKKIPKSKNFARVGRVRIDFDFGGQIEGIFMFLLI